MMNILMAVIVEAGDVWKSAYIPAVMAVAALLKGYYKVDKKLIPPVVLALCILGRAILFPGGFGLSNVLWGIVSGVGAVGTYSGLKNTFGK